MAAPSNYGPAGQSAMGVAQGELDSGSENLAGLPCARLEAMLEASRIAVAVEETLRQRGGNIVAELLAGHETIYEWTHYPTGDVFDRESVSQYYYHAHPGALCDGEHGHFHLFLCAPGLPDGAKPVPYDGDANWPTGASALSHIVAISMNNSGAPMRLFTTNRWVTGDVWYPAADVCRMIERFRIDHGEPSPATNRWITAIVRLFAPDTARLVLTRDAVIENWKRDHPDRDVFEDRALEITSHMKIDVAGRVAALHVLLG